MRNNEFAKYLTRQDFFRKVIEDSPNLERTATSLRLAISSHKEAAESAGKLNMDTTEFNGELSKQYLMVTDSWFKKR